jgi:hypothetical protein
VEIHEGKQNEKSSGSDFDKYKGLVFLLKYFLKIQANKN